MYASYVKETIEAAAGRWASFTGADIQTLSQIISSLTEAEVTLVSRISIRSKVWLRTEQLIKYVETNSSSSEPHDEVNSLLINLAQKGVVDILGLDNNISTLCGENLNNAWDILLDVLVSDEWKTIYKLLKLPPDLMNRRYGFTSWYNH